MRVGKIVRTSLPLPPKPYQKSLEFYGSEAARDSSTGELATINQKLGDTHFALAAKYSANSELRNEQVKQARDWYQKSLTLWTTMKQQNALRLDEQNKTDELAEKISRCDAEMAKVTNAKKAA